jgi:hypothetical protein
MVADQQGSLNVVVLTSPDIAAYEPTTVVVDKIQASSGALQQVLYHRSFSHTSAVNSYMIGADPTGRYLTLSFNAGLNYLDGWLDQGVLRPIPLSSAGYPIAW